MRGVYAGGRAADVPPLISPRGPAGSGGRRRRGARIDTAAARAPWLLPRRQPVPMDRFEPNLQRNAGPKRTRARGRRTHGTGT